jgi:hypothetical protein
MQDRSTLTPTNEPHIVGTRQSCPSIRQFAGLAAHPDVISMIGMLDIVFRGIMRGKDKATAERLIESRWRLLNRRIL